jgi:hypothetical protein
MAEQQAEKTTRSRREKSCQIKGCKRPYKAKGYCNVHYKQWRRGKLPKARHDTAGKSKKKKGEA